jgi:hypothetical protein
MLFVNNRFRIWFTLCIGWFTMTNSALGMAWDALTPYQKHLVTFVLPESRAEVYQADDIQAFLQRHGTRSGIYHAVGMLYRNEGADRKNAQLVMRDLLKLQYNIPGEKNHGMWRTGVGKDREDQNWREFVGVGFIMAREYFGHVLDPDLVRDMDEALIRAAQGASVRDVSPEYTNIALMSAFLLNYTGHIASNPAFIEQGKNKAKAILDLFFQYNTFTEFNSPTYYGTNFLGLGLWRELGKSSELRTWAQEIETVFWKQIAQCYHAGLKNLCGPYVRGYGMDMTQYAALVGLCIAMGLEDGEHAPLPNTKDRAFEWAYAPLFALLNVKPPKDLLDQFKTFSESREVLYQIPHRKKVFQAQVLLEPTWMMGAATGMRRRWNQHCPGTVHWAVGNQVAWLLVEGENAAEVKIEDRKLQIYLTEPDAVFPLRILIYAPDADLKTIADATWTLPGMTFQVETPLSSPQVQMIEDQRFGDVMEVTFPISSTLTTDRPVLVLSPYKTERH